MTISDLVAELLEVAERATPTRADRYRRAADALTAETKRADEAEAQVDRSMDKYLSALKQAETATAQVEALTKALRNLLRCEYDGPGLTDCIDNDGKRYPSAYLYEQIKAAEALLLNQGETDRLAGAGEGK